MSRNGEEPGCAAPAASRQHSFWRRTWLLGIIEESRVGDDPFRRDDRMRLRADEITCLYITCGNCYGTTVGESAVLYRLDTAAVWADVAIC